ncbi:LysR family transcriptional regulator [Actinomadura hibisca]|uniref:LysR family transcriptional regulator n=1 Tax=Actinomadura hibisca TaxID=68565 RepID=UPI000831B194|nr:LysR family transcriptional regulator [Actinomadura hibisca]
MELRDIEIFLTLAEELHFGRTAERLHVSPARVSQAIKKQERAIGADLFERSNRHVALTPIGWEFRDDLLPAYRQIQDAVAKAAAAGRGFTGVLRIGWAAAWCGNLIVKAADRFQERHPDCEVRTEEVPLRDRAGKLRTRELDLQLTELPIDEPGITVGPVLFREPRALVVPADHPLASREFLTYEDYADTRLITLTGPPQSFLDHHFPLRTPSGRPIPRGPATVAFPDVLSLVGMGKGVFPTSTRAREYYSRPDIAIVPFRDAPTIDFGLQWLTSGETVVIREFVKAVLETAADPLWKSEFSRSSGPA